MRVYSRVNGAGEEVWYLDYIVNGKRIRKKVGKGKEGKKIAELSLSKIQVKIAEGKFLDVKRSTKIGFTTFVNSQFKPRHAERQASYVVRKYQIEKLCRFFGETPLDEISFGLIEKYKDASSSKASVGVNRDLSILRCIFNKAKQWNNQRVDTEEKWALPETNPVTGIEFFEEEHRDRYMSDEELRRAFAVAGPRLRDAMLVAIHTGLRKGEIQGIKKEHFDFVHNAILLPDTKSKRLGSTNKTQSVPMNKTVRKIASRYVRNGIEKPFDYDWRTAFETVVEKAKIPNCHFHDLRHTFATLLYKLGVDMYTIARLLRHKVQGPLQVTSIYTAVLDPQLHAAVEKLDDYLAFLDGTKEAQEEKKILSDEDLIDVSSNSKLVYAV